MLMSDDWWQEAHELVEEVVNMRDRHRIGLAGGREGTCVFAPGDDGEVVRDDLPPSDASKVADELDARAAIAWLRELARKAKKQ